MKPGSFARGLSKLGLAALVIAGAASAADVHVMISAGFYGVYSELGPVFERASGHRLVTTRGPSMGGSPEAIPARLARGETADVVILDGGAADELGRRGLLRAASKVDLARSQIGMVVRSGAAKPDIGSVEAFRSALLAAQSVAYSDSGSGTYLSTTLFPKLGVADQIAGKSRKVRGPPSGEPVAAVVARGEAEIGFQQVSELIHVPGVSFVGAIPAELQPGFSFAGALTSNARQPDAGSGGTGDLEGRADAALTTRDGRRHAKRSDPAGHSRRAAWSSRACPVSGQAGPRGCAFSARRRARRRRPDHRAAAVPGPWSARLHREPAAR